MTLSVQKFFEAETGIIAGVKKDFSPRKGQVDLSKTILDAYTDHKHVIVEAPTGYGKSFAVLVPAIIKCISRGGRVVISTETLTLQDQYVLKDLPLLKEACAKMGILFTFAVAKGRGNYICRAKLDEDTFEGAGELMGWGRRQRIFYEESRQFKYDSGDIASVPFEFDGKEWKSIGADEDCEKGACPYYGEGRKGSDCFCYAATKRFLDAQIVVTNHTLLLLDAQVGSGVLLGEFDMLIVDEAHSLPEKAQDAWGTSIKPRTVSRTIRLIDKILKRVGINEFQPKDMEKYYEMERAVMEPFDKLLGKNINLSQINDTIIERSKDASGALCIDLKNVYNALGKYLPKQGQDYGLDVDDSGGDERSNDPKDIAVITAREKLAKIIHDFKVVYGDQVDEAYTENWLSFLQTGYNAKREPYAILNLKPIDVGPLMQGLILNVITSVTMMSATMKINGNYYFMKHELGMPEGTIEFTGASPFTYETQVVGYFPKHLPDQDDENYLDALVDEIVQVIKHMNGRTMILFTNVSQMRLAWEWVSRRVDYPCYVQGQAQKKVLIDLFQSNIHSCLFATRSFFTGVDIPGETLSCVALVKAPFRVPTEPMFKAKCDLLDSNGTNSFANYSLPLMLFDVRQAFGRLIRSINDRGMFVLLDSRALKKSYGNNIMRSLPKMPQISHIGEAPAKPKPSKAWALEQEED